LNHIYAQVIDDDKAQTLAQLRRPKSPGREQGGNIEAAKKIGQTIAERALAAGSAAWCLIAVAIFITGAYAR
jgi:large subunit ribosomal protein L18